MIDRRPRVLHFITHLALGGAERAAFNIMSGLRDRYDFGLYVANGVDPGEVGQSMKRELEEMNVPLFIGTNVPIKFGGMLLAGIWGSRAAKQFKPDILHAHTEIPEASYAMMVCLKPSLTRIPLVRTIQNSIYWDPWRKLGRWCDRHMTRSYLACVSNAATDAAVQLRNESGAGPFAAEPQLIFNSVIVKNAPKPLDSTPGERVRILFAGRFEDQKGADMLPQILRQISLRNGQQCELVIHGSGTHEALLRSLAANPPAGWSIEVHGPVANISSRMTQFDLLIMPSRYEGLSLLAIEAAMLALPIIATDGPGFREGFPPGYPWLAKAGDADSFARLLQQALDDPQSWSSVARQSQAFAKEQFDVSVMCDAYDRLYKQVLANARQ